MVSILSIFSFIISSLDSEFSEILFELYILLLSSELLMIDILGNFLSRYDSIFKLLVDIFFSSFLADFEILLLKSIEFLLLVLILV